MSKKIIKSAEARGDQHTGWQSGDGSPVLNKRVRQVYPTGEVPHKWAHQTQGSARNPQGNLFFEGPTIYSYRTSWPLARIYHKTRSTKFRESDALVLTNSERYSVTTAQHQNAVNRACEHLPRIEVPRVLIESAKDHDENLKYLAALAESKMRNAERAMTQWRFNNASHWARQTTEDIGRYMAWFGIRRKAPMFDAARCERARERIARVLNPDPASRDKRERASAQRRAAKVAKEARANERKNLILDPCARTDWRLFGAFGVQGGGYYNRPGAVMLRVNGEEIETSMGARVPLAAAPMVWNLVERARRAGGYESAGFGKALRSAGRIQIGDYPLDRIDADGTLHAGCHVIPYSELAAMARALNL